jgi:hypothetical protein
MSLALCKKIAEGRSKGMSLAQIRQANFRLWMDSELAQFRDDWYAQGFHTRK